jgi:hypothetical protein
LISNSDHSLPLFTLGMSAPGFLRNPLNVPVL